MAAGILLLCTLHIGCRSGSGPVDTGSRDGAPRDVVTSDAARVPLPPPASCPPAGSDGVVMHPVAEEPAGPPRDLAAIRAEGVIRILVWRRESTALPRAGLDQFDEVERAGALARKLGVQARFVRVPRKALLEEALRAGRGDLVATPLRVREAQPGLRFSTPVRHVQEVVVIPRAARKTPRTVDDLAGVRITVRQGTAAAQTASRIREEIGSAIEVEERSDLRDTDELLYGVGSGRFEATIALSHHVETYRVYRDDVRVAFAVDDEVPLAWLVPDRAAGLLDTVNGFVYQHALTTHRRSRYAGDLDEIRKRGVIRVAMLNNAVAYFIYRGQEVGFQFELAELLSRRLAIRLEVVVPDRPMDLTRLLVENRADVALITPNREDPNADAIAVTPPVDRAEQILVQPAGREPIDSLTGLMGATIHVRRSSQYFGTVRLLSWVVPGLEVVEVPEEQETEDLIDQVGRGRIPLTVANSALLAVERSYRDDIQGTMVLAQAPPLVFSARRDAPRLLARLERFVREDCRGPWFDALYAKYFSPQRRMTEVRSEALAVSGAISPYDDLARRYGRKYGIDWRLILAQMYQESRFDPAARSWAGARGLLQVMPRTGAELGVEDLWDPEQNIHAGVRYLAHLLRRFEPTLPMRQRVRFALAAYNAGIGHVRDARRLARDIGLDPDRWFGHVERAMKLLARPRYHRRARHGYVRGEEPMQYVSRIQTKYDAYTRLMPAEGRKE